MLKYLKKAVEKPKEDITAVRETVREILEKIREEGEAGLRYYSEKFDNWSPKKFRVTDDEILAAKKQLPVSEIEDIQFCQAQIRNFAREQMRRLVDFEVETMPGVHLGQKIIPVASSGSYVPGGRYPMLASAHMTVITPKIAGVPRVVACSPPVQGQGLWPATLYSMVAAGADEIYCMGSVHALAALVYSVDSWFSCMLVGAGNKYVAEAKGNLWSRGDRPSGRSDRDLIIADEAADPLFLPLISLGRRSDECQAMSDISIR
jgi:sulfopropanediol 3-dehydrogenase